MSTEIKYLEARYYILYLGNILDPKVLPYHFPSRDVARYNLKKILGMAEVRRNYRILRGSKLRKYHPKLYQKVALTPSKYKYPDDKSTSQERKSYRTRMRRRLRRMNILVVGKSTGKIKAKPKRMKVINNRQKVAKTPNSIARVIQIDGHSKRYYLILRVIDNDSPGAVCSLYTWCYNISKRTVSKKLIHLFTTSIVTPYLTSELHELCLKHRVISPIPLMPFSTKSLNPTASE